MNTTRFSQLLEPRLRHCACRDCYDTCTGPFGTLCDDCADHLCRPDKQCAVDEETDDEV